MYPENGMEHYEKCTIVDFLLCSSCELSVKEIQESELHMDIKELKSELHLQI